MSFKVFWILALLQADTGHAEEAPRGILTVNPGLIIWTLLAFTALFIIISKYAVPPLIAAVKAREEALEAAIADAARDREAAAAVLAEQRKQLDAARADADKLIQEGRAAGEKVRAVMIEETRAQQQEMLERARREIESEKERAIYELRREAVDLALAGASKVIERNLDSESDRRLVENFLGSIDAGRAR